jgi:hypothetical protein
MTAPILLGFSSSPLIRDFTAVFKRFAAAASGLLEIARPNLDGVQRRVTFGIALA